MKVVRRLSAGALGLLATVGVLAPAARADAFLPHPANAQWQYRWTDSAYNRSGTTENVVVASQQGASFTLSWASPPNQPPTASSASVSCSSGADIGTISFQDTNAGLVNTTWNSCPPPPQMPILCSTATCPNSLASAFYDVIWGSRSPVLSEPLLQETAWTATGGAANDVSSSSQYVGQQLVKVPAFPTGVEASVVRTQIVQVGALGDPYGSGLRTTWWVRGVGPVRVVIDHEGNPGPVTEADLMSTNLTPAQVLPDQNYFPLKVGLAGKYRWTNSRYMRKPEVERVNVSAAVNGSAKLIVKSVSGPMRVAGQYGFTTRLDGVTNIWGSSSAASLVKWPTLGHRRHFFTPLDLMTYGFNPLIPAYPVAGNRWRSGNPVDFHIYGVSGHTRIVGVRRVHVPAGTFSALELTSTLTQKGSRFGSGSRTMWLAPGRGLVKLVFRHRDRSVDVVQLVR
ncbi:MAG TPA: hypothetical protein VFN87_01140 [Solirubrobacteraceae bacterium]|nr:hypothetical protein [Solirubrobacteraceae bacterium]